MQDPGAAEVGFRLQMHLGCEMQDSGCRYRILEKKNNPGFRKQIEDLGCNRGFRMQTQDLGWRI